MNKTNFLARKSADRRPKLRTALLVIAAICGLLIGNTAVLAQQQCDVAFINHDFTFDLDGIATTPINNAGSEGFDIAVQTDGKLVVAGRVNSGSTNFNFSVIRYNSNGSLDTGFGTSGVVVIDFSNRVDQAKGVAIQPDGKIVVAGSSCLPDTNQSCNFALARLNANGTLDPTFGNLIIGPLRSGKQTTDFGGFNDDAFAVRLQADGKIVVGGRANTASNSYNFALARYNGNGTLDSAFSGDGKAVYDVGFTEGARDLAIQPDGKIIAVGSGNSSMKALRITSTGLFDRSFGQAGVVTVDFSGLPGEANSVVLQPDGKILLGGGTQSFGVSNSALARLNANGTPDTTFNGSGKLVQDVYPGNDQVVEVLLVGEIYAVLQTDNSQTLSILHYKADIPTPCVGNYSHFFGGNLFPFAGTVRGSKFFVTGSFTPSLPGDTFVAAFETDVNY